MRLSVGRLWARVVEATAEELAWLDARLRVQNTAAKFARGPYKPQATQHLFSARERRFPAGLLAWVRKGALRAVPAIVVDVLDEHPAPPVLPWRVVPWLDTYQWDALDALIAAGRGVAQCPTASGKTEILAALAHRSAGPVLFVAMKAELVTGFAERFTLRTGEACTVLDGRGKVPAGARVFAGTAKQLASLARKSAAVAELLKRVHCLLVDECQNAAAPSMALVLRACSSAAWRFGVSATPFQRSDGRNALVAAWLGGVVYRIETAALVELGAVARPTVYLHRYATRPIVAPDVWAEARRALVVENAERNVAVLTVLARVPKPAIVFVREVAHGRALLLAWQRLGHKDAAFVNGEDASAEERLATAARVERGELSVLISTAVFQEGVNLPSLRAVVHASAGASHVMTLQNAGRGMRSRGLHGEAVKSSFEIHDLYDVSCGCRTRMADGGYLWTHRVCRWADKHSTSRLRAYTGAGFEVRGP